MDAFGKEYFLSQSVSVLWSFKCCDDVFKRKCLFNGKVMFQSALKKDTEKVVLFCYLKRKAWCNLLSSPGLKKFCACFYHQTIFWGAWNISCENDCAHLKMKGSFHSAAQFGSWFLKKNITRCTFLHRCACMHQKSQRGIHKIFSVLKLPLCGLVVFIDMKTFILTEEGRSFKTFLKEN